MYEESEDNEYEPDKDAEKRIIEKKEKPKEKEKEN